MEYKKDELSILKGFIKASEQKLDLSNHKIFEKFMKTNSSMDTYKKYFTNLSRKNNTDANINSLLFMNLLFEDLVNYIADNQEDIKQTHQFRLGAIGKISSRMIKITEENLALLKNGFGTSVITNLRLMLESFSIAKYLMNCNDIESDRFQDFGIVQECKISNTDPRIKLERKNYSDDFLNPKSDFAWVSDKSIRTPIDLINRLGKNEIIKWYKFYCKYVHASPYSCGKVHQMNQTSAEKENIYMPIKMKNLIQQNKYYISLFINLNADNFILDKTVKELFKKISFLIYNFQD